MEIKLTERRIKSVKDSIRAAKAIIDREQINYTKEFRNYTTINSCKQLIQKLLKILENGYLEI